MTHHSLDPYPIPKDKSPLYLNEPWLFDKSGSLQSIKPGDEKDNIRIYVPLDLNREAILKRLDYVINYYGEASENNEFYFRLDVDQIIYQLEIYDQVWFVRHMPEEGKHSQEAIALAKEFISRLENIPDACAECFPFETIDELKQEYLSK